MISPVKPTFKIKPVAEKAGYGEYILEPLEQGFGRTIGTALRRCLLSSLAGAAITQIKIDGVRHQFSTLPGVKEDIVELILNLKQIRVAYQGKKEVKAVLEAKGPGEVTAKEIKLPAGVKLINPQLHLCTLADKKAKLSLELWINTGYGYSSAEERKSNTLGVMPVDALFSPITRVNYLIEATRVGRRTDFDKLVMQIWTDGSLKPKLAMEEAAKIIVSYFTQVFHPVYEEEKAPEIKVEDNEVLKLTVEELDLPTRIANALRRGGYGTVKDLTKAKPEDISKVKNLGKKSIETITEKLTKKGVSLKQ